MLRTLVAYLTELLLQDKPEEEKEKEVIGSIIHTQHSYIHHSYIHTHHTQPHTTVSHYLHWMSSSLAPCLP